MEQTEEHPLRTFLVKVISGGRVTIPEEIREVHGVKEGSIVHLKLISVVKPPKKGKSEEQNDW